MDDRKRNLQGSESRDIFKRCHKQKLNRSFYAIDADLILIKKYPPEIVAYLDFKKSNDRITFAEVIAYNEWMLFRPVYVVQSDDSENGPFDILKYKGGDYKPNPPIVDLELIEKNLDWIGLQKWEGQLRNGVNS